MLCNARIRDSKRVGKKNKKPESRRRGWMVKMDETSKRKPAPKLMWSPQTSPFSQLTLPGRHAELNPLFSASPKLPALHLRPFSSHSSPDDSIDSLTAEINSCSLHE